MELYKKYVLIALVLTVILLCPRVLLAGIVVAPDRHILELSPGETETVAYTISNKGTEPIEIYVELKDWAKVKENGGIDIHSWLFPKQKSLKIKTDESAVLTLDVKAPQKAVGEFVAMIFLCFKETQDSIINLRKGTPLYLIIKDTQEYQAKINDIKFSYGRVEERQNKAYLAARVSIENTGNMHIRPDIAVYIKDADGRLVKKMGMSEGKILFGDKSEVYNVEWWDPSIYPGTYNVLCTVKYKDKLKDVKKESAFTLKLEDQEMKLVE